MHDCLNINWSDADGEKLRPHDFITINVSGMKYETLTVESQAQNGNALKFLTALPILDYWQQSYIVLPKQATFHVWLHS